MATTVRWWFCLSTEGREAHRATTRFCDGGIGGGRNWRKKAESKEKEEKLRKLDTHKVILRKSCCTVIFAFYATENSFTKL